MQKEEGGISEGRIKKEELGKVFLGSLQDRYKDRDQLAAFLADAGQFFRGDYTGVGEQIKPVCSFLDFSQAVTAFCPNRCAGAQNLFAHHLSFRCLGQSGKEPNNLQGEALGSNREVVIFLLHS